jgi:hypothetical protein
MALMQQFFAMDKLALAKLSRCVDRQPTTSTVA